VTAAAVGLIAGLSVVPAFLFVLFPVAVAAEELLWQYLT
jgi:hypothetical protein